ncbi:hypothetical protein FRB91_004140 [Serendipita sp. 411]|nr:hypothetical protein FRB91_004140 [Serendipita sp. 411]
MTSKIAIIPKGVLSASSTSLVSRDSTKSGVELENTTALSFLKLPHPRTDLPALFLPFSSESSVDREEQILEVQAVNPPASRSWFTDDNTVLEDGRLLLLTPIDPMFLLLPILRLANPSIESGTFQTIDAIFEAASQKVYEQQLEIGENTDDIPNYKDIILLSRMNFVPSALSRICDCQAGRTKLACDLLSQYLSPWIYQELLKLYDFKSLDQHLRSIQAADVGVSHAEGKGKSTAAGGKKRKADTQTSRGVQKLQKTDTSKMNKLTSFFQKKSTA